MRILDQSEESRCAKEKTGAGPSYIYLAIVALEAAAMVRGRVVIDDPEVRQQ